MPGPDEAVPQRVWVLMGGDSPERQVSLASGLAVWLRLRTRPDLIVRPLLLIHHKQCCAGCWDGCWRGNLFIPDHARALRPLPCQCSWLP